MILCACLTTIIHKAHSARDFFAEEFIYRPITNIQHFIIVLYSPKLKRDIALTSIKKRQLIFIFCHKLSQKTFIKLHVNKSILTCVDLVYPGKFTPQCWFTTIVESFLGTMLATIPKLKWAHTHYISYQKQLFSRFVALSLSTQLFYCPILYVSFPECANLFFPQVRKQVPLD